MTGQEAIDRACILIQSGSDRQLESGQTLGQFLSASLQLCLDEVFEAWSWEWAFQPSTAFPTVAGQRLYTIPDSVVDPLDVFLDTGAIDSRKLLGLPLRTFRTKWAALTYLPMDKPTDWARVDDTHIEVAPIPNSNTYTLQIGGLQRITYTDPALQIPQIPSRNHEVMVYGLAVRGAQAIADMQKATELMQGYASVLKRMIVADKRQPDTEYQLRGFRANPLMYSTDYWANPFIRQVR